MTTESRYENTDLTSPFFSTGIYFLWDEKQKSILKTNMKRQSLIEMLSISFGTTAIVIKRRLNIRLRSIKGKL